MVLFDTTVSFHQSINFNITGQNNLDLEPLACWYSVQRSYQNIERQTHHFFKKANTPFNIVLKNLTTLRNQLAKSPRCVVDSVSVPNKMISDVLSIKTDSN